MYVSIVIPAFNAERTINYCIESCIRQLDYIKEIIIVDDFSQDNTILVIKELIESYPHLIKFYSNPIKGGNNARNFGFKKATGKFIQWLDADDELGENKLKQQVEFLLSENNFHVAYCDWIMKTVDETGEYILEYNEEEQCDKFLIKLLKDKWLPPHAYLLRYESALKIYENNGWNPESIVLQDREYYTIGALIGLNFGYVKNTHVIYYRYKFLKSVSKVNIEKRSTALLNLMLMIKSSTYFKNVGDKQIKSLIDSSILISQILLGQKIRKYLNPTKIHWKLFPGNRLKMKAIFRLYIPFY